MKQALLYGLSFLACSIIGFIATLYMLPKIDDAIRRSQKNMIPVIIRQEFKNLSASELVSSGEKLWSEKKYTRSLLTLEAGYGRSKRRSPLRKKAANYIGLQYYYGQGVERNLEKAYAFLSLPVLSETRQAVYLSGLILMNRKYSGFNLDGARKHLRKAEKSGIIAATKELDKIGR